MSLTNKDLGAIQAIVVQVVGTAIDEKVPAIVERIVDQKLDEKLDGKLDPIMRQIAAGFEEVHHRIDGLTSELRRSNDRIGAETKRNDHQDSVINQILTSLHAA